MSENLYTVGNHRRLDRDIGSTGALIEELLTYAPLILSKMN